MIEITFDNEVLRRYPPKYWRWTLRNGEMKSRNMDEVKVGDIIIELGKEMEVTSIDVVQIEM